MLSLFTRETLLASYGELILGKILLPKRYAMVGTAPAHTKEFFLSVLSQPIAALYCQGDLQVLRFRISKQARVKRRFRERLSDQW